MASTFDQPKELRERFSFTSKLFKHEL